MRVHIPKMKARKKVSALSIIRGRRRRRLAVASLASLASKISTSSFTTEGRQMLHFFRLGRLLCPHKSFRLLLLPCRRRRHLSLPLPSASPVPSVAMSSCPTRTTSRWGEMTAGVCPGVVTEYIFLCHLICALSIRGWSALANLGYRRLPVETPG